MIGLVGFPENAVDDKHTSRQPQRVGLPSESGLQLLHLQSNTAPPGVACVSAGVTRVWAVLLTVQDSA